MKIKVVRGRTPCRICVRVVAWNDTFAEADRIEKLRECPWRATGRDGLCTPCRGLVRANIKHLRWSTKQFDQGGDCLPAWSRDDPAVRRSNRPAARWRVKVRRGRR